jgi:hypothetical protein
MNIRFGLKEEVAGDWRRLHNEKLYASRYIIRVIKLRRMRWAGHVARTGEMRNAYNIMVVNPERKRPLGRLHRRWEDNIRMDLREIGWEVVDWIQLVQDREQWRDFMSIVMNLRVR